MKVCFKCGEEKTLNSFYKHPEMSDGHLNKCKECTISDTKTNKGAKKEYYLRYDRARSNLAHRIMARKEYAATEKGKEKLRKSKEAWAKRNPEKRKAHHMVNNAVRDGLLFPLPCEVCFSTHDLHAHHDDYSKPLEVRWLCCKHHAELHKEERQF